MAIPLPGLALYDTRAYTGKYLLTDLENTCTDLHLLICRCLFLLQFSRPWLS